jgi:hypothetical protein
MDLELCLLGTLLTGLGLAPLLLRGIIHTRRLWRVGFDLGLSLLAFQAIVLVPQTLILGLCVPQVAGHSFDQVHQPDDQLPGILVLDVAQVNVFQHNGAILFAYGQNGKSAASVFPGGSPSLLR